MGKYVIDTNVLLSDSKVLQKCDEVIMPVAILEELDGLKKADGELGFKARLAMRAIDEATNITYSIKDFYDIDIQGWDKNKRDNQIIYCAKQNDCILISNDICVRKKADALGVPNEKFKGISDRHTGARQFCGDTEFINTFYSELDTYNFVQNEYIVLTDTTLDETYEFRWNNGEFVRLNLPDNKDATKGKQLKGMNALQRCALDLMNNPEIPIKIIMGGYGSGKTYLSVQVALLHLRKLGLYSKILCVREPVGEGKEIGFLKGSKDEKTDDFFKPIEHSLEGGEFELLDMIKRGQLEKEIPYYMKGCTFNETIILCDEAEDIHYKQLKLIGTRLGQNSCIYLMGDYKQSVYDTSENNGLIKLVEQLKGNPMVGVITLEEDVRSHASKIFADLE